MLFNSFSFLVFFPLVTLLYYVMPKKYQWVLLWVSSYYFYMCWNPKYLLLLLVSTVITYASGLLIDKCAEKRMKKLVVFGCVGSNLIILASFKYLNWVIENINHICNILGNGKQIGTFDIILPVGISFYIFQALSYTIDVYREEIKPEKNFGKYALFVSFFPQLVAGPIERSGNLLTQLEREHYFDFTRVRHGVWLMLWGYFQKVVIADRCAILVTQVFDNYSSYRGFEIAIAAIMFAIQIYCDFGGYSDIAIGAAEVLGIDLMKNFDVPYFSTSIHEFWKRWHISLTSWFRDYVYIPLGGNRKGKLRKYANTMLVFLLSGLWHGANWTYVYWGGVHGLYEIIGDCLKPIRNRISTKLNIDKERFSYKIAHIVGTFALVDFAWIFFRANTLSDAIGIIKQMFTEFNIWVFFDGSLYNLGLDNKEFALCIISIVILLIADYLKKNIFIMGWLDGQAFWFKLLITYSLIFFILIFGVYGYGYNASEFIYFQF